MKNFITLSLSEIVEFSRHMNNSSSNKNVNVTVIAGEMALVVAQKKASNITALNEQKRRYQASGNKFKTYIDGAILMRNSAFDNTSRRQKSMTNLPP